MRRSRPEHEPEAIGKSLVDLLTNFAAELEKSDLRAKVIALIPAFHKLRDLGSSLIPKNEASSARARVIAYFQRYPRTVIDGDELMVVSGIAEWARRVRELRVQFGWAIYSGVTFRDMADDASAAHDAEETAALESTLGVDPSKIKPDQYVLMREKQDLHAAYRWNVLNEIRRKEVSVTDKIIEYFRRNAGEEITGEELKYLAKDKKEWARRVRELRTEYGWPIVTKNSGREDLGLSASAVNGTARCFHPTTQERCLNCIICDNTRTGAKTRRIISSRFATSITMKNTVTANLELSYRIGGPCHWTA